MKKSRSAGRQSKEAAPEETSQCVFVDFVRVAGVTLRQGGMPNEIGKRTQFSFETKQGCKLNEMLTYIWSYPSPGVDQVVFQRRIQQQIQKSPRYPGVSINRTTTLQ